MLKPCKSVIIAGMTLTALMAAPALAEQSGSPIPFGGYRKDSKCGCYGTKAAVKSADQARKIIQGFLLNQDLRISAMYEFPRFFKADLVDANGTLNDVVIVDKITGRVRSIN